MARPGEALTRKLRENEQRKKRARGAAARRKQLIAERERRDAERIRENQRALRRDFYERHPDLKDAA